MSEKKPFELKKMWQWLVYLYVVLAGTASSCWAS